MVKDKDSKYMGYNCQMAVDEESHAIVGAEVFNEASDRGLLQPMIEEVRDQTGRGPEQDRYRRRCRLFQLGQYSVLS